MARIPPPPDPTLPPSKTKCRCGCGRLTHTYRDTRTGALRDAKFTHACYLRRIEAARRTGRPPGRPALARHQKRTTRVVLRVTDEESQRLRDLAADYSIPVAELIVKVLDKTVLAKSRASDNEVPLT